MGGFGAEPGQVGQGSGEGSTKGSGEGLGDFGAEPHQVQPGSREGSGEGSGGGVGAEPSRDQPGFGKCWGEGSGEDLGDFGADPEGSGRLWWRGGPGSTRFRRRFWRRFRKVLVRPGSTRLQVGSGAIPGLCRRRFRSSSSKIRTNKIMTIIYCCCKLVFFD